MAETLYSGADLVMQVHYHPTGKPEKDRTRVGFYFTDRKPERHGFDIPLESNRIDIPPGDKAYKVTDHFTLPVDVELIGINPHAHYVCKEMYGYAVLPDGTRRTLILIKNWDFNWQQQYLYPAGTRLPADTRLEMEYTYDNSAANVRNPNHPPKRCLLYTSALYNEFERDPPAPVKTALRDELASIMTPLGLRFEWRDLRGPRQKPAIELAVISFKGRCDAAGLLPRQGDSSGALGWTHISDGVILPFSDVDCDGIRRFLQPALLTVSSASREGAFGRAVARVLAHDCLLYTSRCV